MTEKFKIITNAGDYHLMNGDEELCYDLCSPTMMPDNWNKVVDKLNKQDEKIKELEIELRNKTEKWKYELGMKLKYHSKLIDSEKENEQLKDFIKKLADDTGRIILRNGYGYHISKVINDD